MFIYIFLILVLDNIPHLGEQFRSPTPNTSSQAAKGKDKVLVGVFPAQGLCWTAQRLGKPTPGATGIKNPATAPGFPLSPAAHWTVGLRTGRFILYLLVQLPSRQPGGPGRIGDAGWERPSRRQNGASCDSRIHPSALAVAARFPELGVSAHEGRERPAGRSAFP